MNRNDERYQAACALLADALGREAKYVDELAWIGISGQAQAGVIGLGIPLKGMTEDERLDYFINRATEMAGIASRLADVFGGPVSLAGLSISVALRGEFAPIEQYGISLNAREHRSLQSRWDAIIKQSGMLA